GDGPLGAGSRVGFCIPDRSRVDLGHAGRDGGALVMGGGRGGARALAAQSVNRELNDPSEVQPTAKQTSVTVRSPRRSRTRSSSVTQPPSRNRRRRWCGAAVEAPYPAPHLRNPPAREVSDP